LGERELCKLEVVGSIPIGSTNLRGEAGEVVLRSLGEGGPSRPRAAPVGRPSELTNSLIIAVKIAVTTENTGLRPVAKAATVLRTISDIVKAGLAGLHDRLI
jgi:hypothetical protein